MKKNVFQHVASVSLMCCLLFSACKKEEDKTAFSATNIQLSGANEVPAITTTGTGTLAASYDKNTKKLTYTVNWSGLALSNGNIAISGANEVPAITTTGTGTLNVSYNRTTKVLSFTSNWANLQGGGVPTAMHFHGPAPAGQNAGVAVGITGFTPANTGSFSGTTRPLTDTEEADLLAGRWYYNLHTAAFPGGELRGQVIMGIPVAMHFHGPAPVGQNAGVVEGITGFTPANTGTFSGTTRTLTDSEEADLLGGRWYINLHTPAFPGGELRGQVVLQ